MLMRCATADAEIELMALLARTVGGMRAGDLVALTWDAFDPEFTTCMIVRRKTQKKNRKPSPLDVPPGVRPFLVAWKTREELRWKDREEDPPRHLFPSRRRPRVGQPKKNSNVFAARLRRDLKKAGVTRHELHNETATTLPADFHSCRRAFATALARVGVNEQTAMLLTGHSDAKVHRRYLNELVLNRMPEAAVPVLDGRLGSAAAFCSRAGE
jgi:integrase